MKLLLERSSMSGKSLCRSYNMENDLTSSSKDSGFIRLSRGFFNNFLWAERRAYSKAEAWLDIVAQCPYEPLKRLVAGELVEVPRGGFVASERYFSDRWMWSRTKVRSFLALLEQEKMILKKPQKDHRNTTFLLCNYDKYNPPKDHEPDHWKTTERPVEDQIEEDKNIINKYKTRARTCAYGAKTPTLDEVLGADTRTDAATGYGSAIAWILLRTPELSDSRPKRHEYTEDANGCSLQ